MIRWRYLFLFCFSLIVAGPLLLTTLAPYDDEGYVMLTLRSFAEKKPLYNQTYTQYGPAYYLLTEPLHTVLGLPLSQHGVRFKTAMVWAAVVLLAMGIAQRLSGNFVLSLFSSCMIAIHLSRLALEPGHPQEVALLMSFGALWLVCDGSPKRWWLAGCCAALCGMCKLNVGLATTLPLLLAAAVTLPKIRFFRTSILVVIWLVGTTTIGATMLPRTLGTTAISTSAAILASWCAVSFLTLRTESTKRAISPLAGTLIAGIFVSIGVAIWTMLRGTSVSMLAWGLVGQHGGFARTFFQPISIDLFAILSGLAVTACYWNRRAIAMASFVCLAIAVLKTASTSIWPLTHQIQNGSEWLAVIGPCFAPALLLFRKRLLRGRVMLAGLTAVGPWIAFPIPGTQLMLGTLPAWLTLGVVASDAMQFMTSTMRSTNRFVEERQKWISYSRILFGASCAVGLLASFLATTKWIQGESLNLAGSEWIHVDGKEAQLEQTLVRKIQQSGATHLVFDGHAINRMYFWTGLKPLTDANATLWPYMLAPTELEELRKSVDQSRSLCVAVPPDVPRPQVDSTLQSQTRQSLYRGTSFLFQDPSGWEIGIRQ